MVTKKLNKRSKLPAALPDENNIVDTLLKGYVFFGTEVTAGANVTLPQPPLDKWYQDSDGFFYWSGGLMIIKDERISFATTSLPVTKPLLAAPLAMPVDMPLNYRDCIKCANWMKVNFEDKIVEALQSINNEKGTFFDKELVYAIACQETAQRWKLWINELDTATLLQRCVFDASGDVPGKPRNAFPKNKAAMIAKYGEQVTQMLVDEANKMRVLPQPDAPNGYHSSSLLYKGYGIFQYDLQHFETDAAFFTQKLWYSIDECINRLLEELVIKWNEQNGNLFETVRSYNGRGERAVQYANNVSQFYTWIRAMQ